MVGVVGRYLRKSVEKAAGYNEELRSWRWLLQAAFKEVFQVYRQEFRTAWKIPGLQESALHPVLDGANRDPENVSDVVECVQGPEWLALVGENRFEKQIF